MKLDFETQKLAYKLKRVYELNNRDGKIDYVCGLCGDFFMLDDLYDYILSKDIKIEFKTTDGTTQEQVKKIIWKSAKSTVEIWALNRQLHKEKLPTEEEIKAKEIAVYKSELIYLFLVQKYNLEDQQFRIWDEDGVEIKPILFKENKDIERKIKELLSLRTFNIVIKE